MAGVRVPILHRNGRGGLCTLVWGAALLAFASAAANAAPIACAIRWDAWYTNGPQDPGAYTARALSVPAWRDRAPRTHISTIGRDFVGAFAGDVRRRDSSCRQGPSMLGLSRLRRPWRDRPRSSDDAGLWFHRRSAIRDEVDYALMTTPSLLVGGSREAALAATLQLLKDRIISASASPKRLVPSFSFTSKLPRRAACWRMRNRSAKPSVELRAGSERLGLGDPYVAVTLSGAKRAKSVRAAIGADAISQYVAGRRRGRQSWAQFEPSIEADWDLFVAATSGDVVPTLRSGADIRARCQTPPPFDHRFAASSPCDDFVFNPTAEELQQEFRHARA